MDLREYLFRKRLTIEEFSKTINYDRTYIGQVANGKKKPGRKMAKIIEQATGGIVKAEELLSPKLHDDFEDGISK